jgi:hypothetical protein
MTLKLSLRQSQVISAAILLLAAGWRLWGIAEIPPGLHDDEAFHLLNAQAIALGQALPVYITGNNGNEPGFAYLAAVARLILGPAVAWTGRLVAAWAGLVGVALTLRAGKELFPKTQVGNLAGLALATLFWNLDLSRFGSQPILAATAAAGVIAALWCGVRRGNPWVYGLAGVSLAAGLWSYVLFRLFPLVPLAVGLALLVIYPSARRPSLVRGGLIAVGVALLLYAPLGLWFIQHPDWFFNRYNQTTGAVLGAGQQALVLWTNTLKTVGGLFFVGDSNWRHNLSGRPALDAVQSLFFLAGCGVCLWRWRQPEYSGLLVWLVVGLLPGIVSAEAPHFGRTVMATPVLALLVALGLGAIWRRLGSRLGRGLVIAAVLLSTLLTGVDFFGRRANDPNLKLAFDADPAQAGSLLRAAPAQAWLYDTRPYYSSWIFEYLLGPAGMARFRIFDAGACWVAPALTAPGAAYAIDTPMSLAALRAIYPGGTLLAPAVNGLPEQVYWVPPGQAAHLEVATPHPVDFNGQVRLLGYTLPAQTLKPGGELKLEILWQVEDTPLVGGKIFIHLWGPPKADGSVIYSQDDLVPCGNSYPTDAWRPGERIAETYRLALPADLPPGDYTLHAGWYVYANGTAGPRLPAFDDAGRPLGGAVQLETISVPAP